VEVLGNTAVPAAVSEVRAPVLHRALRNLPVELLEPLLDGLRRYADSLKPGSLENGAGEGCAIGMMLREIASDPRVGEALGDIPPARRQSRFRRQGPSVYHCWPELAKAQPRLLHLEALFDSTCAAMASDAAFPADEIPRAVGLWMAAETESEINMRHLEDMAADGRHAPVGHAGLDERLFEETVDRLMELRPWLSRAEAAAAVAALSKGR